MLLFLDIEGSACGGLSGCIRWGSINSYNLHTHTRLHKSGKTDPSHDDVPQIAMMNQKTRVAVCLLLALALFAANTVQAHRDILAGEPLDLTPRPLRCPL